MTILGYWMKQWIFTVWGAPIVSTRCPLFDLTLRLYSFVGTNRGRRHIALTSFIRYVNIGGG